MSSPISRVTGYVGSHARAGAYRRETLVARFGDVALPDVIIALTAWPQHGDYSRPCGAGYVDPPGAR
jgi:hypothetical protein